METPDRAGGGTQQQQQQRLRRSPGGGFARSEPSFEDEMSWGSVEPAHMPEKEAHTLSSSEMLEHAEHGWSARRLDAQAQVPAAGKDVPDAGQLLWKKLDELESAMKVSNALRERETAHHAAALARMVESMQHLTMLVNALHGGPHDPSQAQQPSFATLGGALTQPMRERGTETDRDSDRETEIERQRQKLGGAAATQPVIMGLQAAVVGRTQQESSSGTGAGSNADVQHMPSSQEDTLPHTLGESRASVSEAAHAKSSLVNGDGGGKERDAVGIHSPRLLHDGCFFLLLMLDCCPPRRSRLSHPYSLALSLSLSPSVPPSCPLSYPPSLHTLPSSFPSSVPRGARPPGES